MVIIPGPSFDLYANEVLLNYICIKNICTKFLGSKNYISVRFSFLHMVGKNAVFI